MLRVTKNNRASSVSLCFTWLNANLYYACVIQRDSLYYNGKPETSDVMWLHILYNCQWADTWKSFISMFNFIFACSWLTPLINNTQNITKWNPPPQQDLLLISKCPKAKDKCRRVKTHTCSPEIWLNFMSQMLHLYSSSGLFQTNEPLPDVDVGILPENNKFPSSETAPETLVIFGRSWFPS